MILSPIVMYCVFKDCSNVIFEGFSHVLCEGIKSRIVLWTVVMGFVRVVVNH